MIQGQDGFDFLVGRWVVHNVRLNERLCGCTEWTRFDAHSDGMMILGGMGNFDQMSFPWQGSTIVGCTLRLFDPVSAEWTLHWSDSASGRLFPPQTGRFNSGVGRFYGMERCNGQTVLTRFIWSHMSSASAHWEQAFSADGGETWETNWLMDLEKVGD